MGCGRSIEYDSKYELLGKTVVFKTPMLYTSNLKRNIIGSEGYKYNRYLIREREVQSYYDHFYKSGKAEFEKIKKGMAFKINKSYEVIPWGLQTAFSSKYRILVLLDDKKHASIILEVKIREDEILR